MEKDILESIPKSSTANINPLYDIACRDPKFYALNTALDAKFGGTRAKQIIKSLLRFIYFIQPVKPAINTAKYAVRWHNNPAEFFDFGNSLDPRWCSYEECEALAERLCNELLHSLNDRDRFETVRASTDYNLAGYDIPIDYDYSPIEGNNFHMHSASNVNWIWTNLSEITFKLREFVYQIPDQEARHALLSAMKNKIKVKTYLTDRAQTGPYQTNRELRWEAHPFSVQFSLRRECWNIEHKLIEQIFFFDGFPVDIREQAIQAGLINGNHGITLCPITLEPFNYHHFTNEILYPDHGRSNFQVGHMDPLKTTSRSNSAAGHRAENISWISANGNRIQGHLSLDATREMILNIARRIN